MGKPKTNKLEDIIRLLAGWLSFIIFTFLFGVPIALINVLMEEIVGVRLGFITAFLAIGAVFLAYRMTLGYGKRKEKEKGSEESATEYRKKESCDIQVKDKEGKKIKPKISIKWVIVAGIILIGSLIFAASRKGQKEKITFEETNKDPQFSEYDGNLYRNTKYDFRIKFPEGWNIKSGDGPNILQKAVKGNQAISVGVREIPAEFGDKTATIKDAMSVAEFKNTLLEGAQEKFPGAKIIDYGESKLDNEPTYWIKYSAPYTALDVTVEGIHIQYQVLNNNIFYFITASSISDEFQSVEAKLMKSISTFVIEDY